MFHQDWIIRQIQMMIELIARVFFKKTSIEYIIGDESNLSEADLLHRRLAELVDCGDICMAENLLFESLENGDIRVLEVAADFYQRLNALSDDELESCNFSREEIVSGITEVGKMYGMPDMKLGQ